MRRRVAAALAAGLMVAGMSAATMAPTMAAPAPKAPKLSVSIVDSKNPFECKVKWSVSNWPSDSVKIVAYNTIGTAPYTYNDMLTYKLSELNVYGDGTISRGRGSGEFFYPYLSAPTGSFSAAAYDALLAGWQPESSAVDLTVPNRCAW